MQLRRRNIGYDHLAGVGSVGEEFFDGVGFFHLVVSMHDHDVWLQFDWRHSHLFLEDDDIACCTDN